MWLPDTQVLLTYRTVGSMLIFQYLYINYVPEQVLAVPRSNTEGGAWQGVIAGVSCVMYCICTWSYGDKGTQPSNIH